jgi:phosphoserine phosphatase
MLAIGTLAGSKVALAAYLALIAGTSSFLARRIAERFQLDLVAESVLAGFRVSTCGRTINS